MASGSTLSMSFDEDRRMDYEENLRIIMEKQSEIIAFMAKKSTKISESNQLHIRKLLTELITATTNQGNIISILLGKNMDLRQIIRDILAKKKKNRKKEEPTYAQVTKVQKDRSRSRSRKREESHVVMIYPVEEKASEEVKDEIKISINTVNLQIGIKRIKRKIEKEAYY